MSEEMTVRGELSRLSVFWRNSGLPSWQKIMTIGRSLASDKESLRLPGLWDKPPVMLAATVDDGWGMGLEPICLFAGIAGVEVHHLGLLRRPKAIVAACVDRKPDLLGLTVLHYDTEETLCLKIIPRISEAIRVMVGGPIFKAMSAEEIAAKPYLMFADLGAFVDYLLAYQPISDGH